MVNAEPCSELRRHRRLLAMCCLLSFTAVTPLVVQPFSLYRQSWRAEFGWSQGEISVALSIAGLLFAFALPFAGAIADRYPIRKVVRWFGVFYVLAFFSIALCRGSLLHFYVSFAVLGLSAAGVSQFIYSKLLAQWFAGRLGTALACLTASIALSAIATPLITNMVLMALGWRACWFLWGLVACGLIYPVGSLISQPRENLERVVPRQGGREYLRDPEFWSIAVLFCFLCIGPAVVLPHLAPLLAEIGVPATAIASCVSLYGAGNLIGRFAGGWLLDRWPAPYVIYLSIGSSALGFVGFLFPGLVAAELACFLIGCSSGSEMDILPFLVRRSFGVARLAEIAGSVYMPVVILNSAIVAVTGYSRDAYGSFTPVLLVCLGSSIPAAAVAMLWDGQSRRRQQLPVQLATSGD